MNFAWNRPLAQPSRGEWIVVGIIATAALLLGLFARFKGLGTWSLATDEYYIARSVDNILRTGLPEYPCGGYYTRGLVYQYSLAGLRLLGLSAEYSGRLVTVVSSLIALPAIYLLGKRTRGTAVGLLAMAIIAVSVWEVEMARFARMYVPFQAVFLWYLVYFVRFTVDRESRALLPMLSLSILGMFLWEGGVFLALINLLPPFFRYTDRQRVSARQWVYIAVCGSIAIAIIAFIEIDWRRLGDPLPPDFEWGPSSTVGRQVVTPWATLSGYPLWTALALIPLMAIAWAGRWIVGFRSRWPTMLGLAFVMLAGLFHQFALALSILTLLLLMRLLDWREVCSRDGIPFLIAMVATALFWIAFMLLTNDWRNGVPMPGMKVMKSIVHRFIELPDFARDVIVPWAKTVPLLSAGLAVILGAAAGALFLKRQARLSPERVLLTIVFCIAFLASMGVSPRPETRYLFAVFPVAIVIATATVFRIVNALVTTRAVLVTSIMVSALFVLSDDFHLQHLRQIDHAKFNFRVGMNPALKSHYYPRSDLRQLSATLVQLRQPGDVLVTNVVGLDFYYPAVDVTYIDEANTAQLYDWSCRQGTIDRWGGHPLMYQLDALGQQIASAPRLLLAMDSKRYGLLQEGMEKWSPRVLWESQSRDIVIVTFDKHDGPANVKNWQARDAGML